MLLCTSILAIHVNKVHIIHIFSTSTCFLSTVPCQCPITTVSGPQHQRRIRTQISHAFRSLRFHQGLPWKMRIHHNAVKNKKGKHLKKPQSSVENFTQSMQQPFVFRLFFRMRLSAANGKVRYDLHSAPWGNIWFFVDSSNHHRSNGETLNTWFNRFTSKSGSLSHWAVLEVATGNIWHENWVLGPWLPAYCHLHQASSGRLKNSTPGFHANKNSTKSFMQTVEAKSYMSDKNKQVEVSPPGVLPSRRGPKASKFPKNETRNISKHLETSNRLGKLD